MIRDTKDTSVGIWDYLYKVRIPYLDTFSADYLQKFGVTMPTNKKDAADQMDSLVTTFINIDSMIEYFKNGVCVRVVEQADTKLIYDAIQAHLEAWELALKRGQNMNLAPTEDLLNMDKFANAVYAHAKFMFKENETRTEFTKKLQNNSANLSSMFSKKFNTETMAIPGSTIIDGVTTINPSTGENIPDRESMADFLLDRLNSHHKGGAW
jgi:hypothetical protein